MGGSCRLCFGMMVVLMVCSGARGADDTTDSCVSSITPCASYLNSTHPPKSCCNPLLTVIETQEKCLCNLLSSVNNFGINLTQALELPARCGKNVTTAACKSASGGTNGTTPSSGPSSSSSPSKNSSNSVPRFQFLEALGLLSFLLLGVVQLQF